MALFDWNSDGKKDWQDNFIEYHACRTSMEYHKNNPSSSNGCEGCISTVLAIIVFVIFFGFIGMLMESCDAKCIKSGCDNEQRDGSSYCWLHSGF